MQHWFTQIRQDIAPIFDAITAQPFIQQLIDGSLPREIFHFYITQDALYLEQYKRVLATLGSRCPAADDAQFYFESATGILAVETALHESFMSPTGTMPEPSPTCELYTSYLSRVVHTESLAVGMAAVLPCFTIYKEVGDHILSTQDADTDNPYQDWINTYGGEAFANSVARAVAITDAHAARASADTLDAMNRAFIQASRLEWMFWDSAYHQEPWKI
ncbi:MAG TPA: thiaminase II [Gammaproteobacteria bacterium]|nr:thiaminase II [Gammaproteobacteria bacterium]